MSEAERSLSESPPVPAVTIQLPAAFHALTGGRRQIPGAGDNIRDVLRGLDRDFPGAVDRIMDQDGSVRRYINVYRNDTDIRGLDGPETKVTDGDLIWIIPAVAGGSGTTPSRDS
jgi:molybdopterin converting factor small subunit